MPWLTKNNPHIDWVTKTISFHNEHIRKTTLSTELAIAAAKDEVILPPQYSEYADIFEEQMFSTLPPHQSFDHAIDLKDSFIPKVTKLYPLNPQEVDAVAHVPPAMVLFLLFLFVPLIFAFVLTTVAILFKPGCAVRAADTSSV